MYKVWWKTASGKMIPHGEFETEEEALDEAREPIFVPQEPVAVVVTDNEGRVIFSTQSDDV